MKTNIGIYWVLTAFFLLASAGYGLTHFWLHPDENPLAGDMGVGFWTGVIALALTGILTGFTGYYLRLKYRKQGGELPEDTDTANIDDGDPELGFYSPWSWWPVLLAGAAALVFLGIAAGWWIALYAIPMVLVALVGWTYEYSRGYHGH